MNNQIEQVCAPVWGNTWLPSPLITVRFSEVQLSRSMQQNEKLLKNQNAIDLE